MCFKGYHRKAAVAAMLLVILLAVCATSSATCSGCSYLSYRPSLGPMLPLDLVPPFLSTQTQLELLSNICERACSWCWDIHVITSQHVEVGT